MTGNILNLRNHLLIAMPSMGDPNFDHTVSLICQHDEYGAFGVTINRPLEMTVGELLHQLEIEIHDPHIAGQSALSGGPVQSEQGFVLHDGMRNWDSTLRIDENLALTSSRDILNDIANGSGPQHFLLVLGCAGWSPGQLEHEIKANAWLTCPSVANILFEMPYNQRWKGAALTLGVDVNLLGVAAGHA
ncbi:MAG TPA: YqgE/AlgH family protein [Candidatus Thiothrix moscowensis]|uniref:YqgE/AlgH family protein n=1 Tax=unclassified Thiothrix TaxID=2636184 RepID=UPI001A296941|nr:MULTISPECIES: YqgE/AlgH family protein [unclassified Thiothrix]MBJ6608775.1 YqgE/AlgH family protein [Candidatus Thiothrix moscowensis]HRJ52598.1 YqgE/AlgH family protein [Candidatus Thiothrix moscowensis]HRJ92918.1 YqgE/AlgH family protein [Candidatus Thiothrix moscowensis]